MGGDGDARSSDELGRRRPRREPDRSDEGVQQSRTAPDAVGAVSRDSSAPDVLHLRAGERDAAAAARDREAAERDAREGNAHGEQADLDRLLAARDRAAAALDRQEAALDRRRAEDYLKRTYRDALTGALQREAGRDELEREMARTRRGHEDLVLAFLDVVGLKGINDRWGHAAGDGALRAVGAALIAGLRSYDVVVRYGGDEFVCALPAVTIAGAAQRLEDVQAKLAQGTVFSVGLACLEDWESLDAVIARADRDLYDRRRAFAAAPDQREASAESR